MLKTDYLIIGAGISGLATANYLFDGADYLILEKDAEIGGWCKTVEQDGFVWDYSGHFFHFRHPDIEAYLRARMPEDEVVTVARDSRILYKDTWLDFPFQKNIHQLPKQDFVECLYDLVFRHEDVPQNTSSFKGMLYEKFGRAISEKFLIPYNEKLYACDLDELDREAMGRFFPYAELEDIVRNMRRPDNTSYNAHFTYPKHGAIMYVRALASDVPDDRILLNTGLERVDLHNKIAHTTTGEEIAFGALISSAPFDKLLGMSGITPDPDTFSYNKVLVFNLGFDTKGKQDVHWVYLPEREYCFYRVGYYDNIMNTDRMSLYVELGYPHDADDIDIDAVRARVLRDLERAGIVTTQQLVSHHSVVLDPAYVHITQRSKTAHREYTRQLGMKGVYSIGRYGGWTYCSIEDNILEARELARRFSELESYR